MMNTMTFEEVKKAATMDIAKALGSDWVTKENPVAKNNRGVLTGITFMQEGSNGGPTIYAEDIYEMSLHIPYDEMISGLTKSIRESMRANEETARFFDGLTFEKIKENLSVRLIDKSLNKELLKSRVYMDCSGGLALLADIENDEWRAAINEELLNQLGADKDELFEAALEAAEKKHPAVLTDISEHLFGIPSNLLVEDTSLKPDSLYVLSTENAYMGASVIMYPGMMSKLHDMFGSDFYVLPSSVHEVLVISTGKDPSELHATILSANNSVVDDVDLLSNNLFVCDGTELKIAK